MATDRDRFGSRLGKRFAKCADRVAHAGYSADAVARWLSDYVIRESRRDWHELDRTSQRLRQQCHGDSGTLFSVMPLDTAGFSGLAAAATDSRVASMFLDVVRNASHRDLDELLRRFAGRMLDWIEGRLAIQRSWRDRPELWNALNAARRLVEAEICRRLSGKAPDVSLPRKKKAKLSISEVLNMPIAVHQ